MQRKSRGSKQQPIPRSYAILLGELTELVDEARRQSVRAVNAALTATYWLIGRRVVEEEQAGRRRADYGKQLVETLAEDLSARFGRGFSRRNLFQMRAFYLAYPEKVQTLSAQSVAQPPGEKVQTLSAQSVAQPPDEKVQTLSALSQPEKILRVSSSFPLPWSHYVRLLAVEDPEARQFYETEALRSGWSVRQLDRQISSQFYERTLLSKNKVAMIRRGGTPRVDDLVSPDEEVKDPYVLEFLNLKDEYSESELEAALITQLEGFLLELGGDFAFIGRQRRLRIADEWYRVDLVFFHRRLRCLVVIDLKVGKFTHADAGQMHLYLNYAREHWALPEENPPVGIILCAKKNDEVVHYALEGLPNKVLAAQYQIALPDEETLKAELKRTRRELERRRGDK